MAKYLLLYYTAPEAMAQMANATPEEMMKGMEPWSAWQERLGDNLILMGEPLSPGKYVAADGSDSDSGSQVTGYSIIEAADLDAAKALLKDHPHYGWHESARVEIAETMPMEIQG